MIEILGTGDLFIDPKYQIRGLSSVVERLVDETRHEIILSTYSLGKNPDKILYKIINKGLEGIKVHIIINSLEQHNRTIKKLFDDIKKIPNVYLYVFSELNKGILHAKILCFDSFKVILGSSNFSWSALYSNHELNILMDGEPAKQIYDILKDLIIKFD